MLGKTGKNLQIRSTSPANGGQAVTPSDSVDLDEVSRGLYIGGTGDVTVITGDDITLTFKAVPAGMILPLQVKRVMSTDTSATLIVAMW